MVESAMTRDQNFKFGHKSHIWDSINLGRSGRGNPVDQNCCIAFHQQQGESGDSMVAAFTLIPASLSGHGLCKAFHFSDGYPVPTTKRLEGEGGEGHTLPGTFFISSSQAKSRLKPGVVAAPSTVACCRGLMTVMSRAASRPADQLGMKTSAGLRSVPGSRNRPSLTGFKTAAAAIWCT